MSMHPEEENFESLRRLLALKRHEQPPPGYFDHFSVQVIARIRAGEVGVEASAAEGFFFGFPLLQRFWAALEAKPILAGAFGFAVCGFLTAGFFLSDNSVALQSGSVGVLMPGSGQITAAQIATPAAAPFLSQAPAMDFTGAGSADTVQVRPSLFHQSQVRLVNFSLPSGN